MNYFDAAIVAYLVLLLLCAYNFTEVAANFTRRIIIIRVQLQAAVCCWAQHI